MTEHHVDTLVIVGNGFDLWQGLPTSYYAFKDYYLANRARIKRRLRVKDHHVREFGADGHVVNEFDVGDAELLYGAAVDPDGLSDEFWGSFESSLGEIDSFQLNLFFGKKRGDLRDLKRCARNAYRILRRAFCEWAGTIQIDGRVPDCTFEGNCLFINFNYTDTLVKRFGLDPAHEFHTDVMAVRRRSKRLTALRRGQRVPSGI